MKTKNLDVYYDVEDDTLEIFIGKPSECYYDEVDDDLFEGHDEKTGELKGYKIFNLMKREKLRNVKISLPATVEIRSAS